MSRTSACLVGLLLLSLFPGRGAAQDLGLKLPPGFRVTLFADADLANDIYAMTLDGQGRVVVTSRGWVKRLEDTDGDGKADKATPLLQTRSGGMGMLFDGGYFYICCDGAVQRYSVNYSDGTIRDNPDPFTISLHFGEHGGHAIRKGPDGAIYIVGGNDAGLARLTGLAPNSPVRQPEGGGILRVPDWGGPVGKALEVIAHGFRNPYDFDFTPLGDIITYDSDTERDFLLPWYTPTRLYHVGYGQHHGWRLPGYLRSLARRDYYADTVDVLAPIGRGSPTGVVCYRHTQFPEHYRGGVFFLDWTFGKVYFSPLTPDGATYKVKPEVFIEPVGNSGFAPTDACVAPDGSLFICIGGRGTRGGVFRVEYVGDGKVPVQAAPEPAADLLKVLDAPQPLDAWSRARWEPLARVQREQLGYAPADESLTEAQRVRAVEVLIDQGALYSRLGRLPLDALSPAVRARLAWAVRDWPLHADKEQGRLFGWLLRLADDPSPRVRVAALQSLTEPARTGNALLLPAITANLGHADKRVRLAAIHLASLLPQVGSLQLDKLVRETGPRARLANEIAAQSSAHPQRSGDFGVLVAAEVLESSKDVELWLDAARLIMLCYGDWNLAAPPAEVYSAYALPAPERLTGTVLRAVRPRFPSGDERLDIELSRLLAMFEDDDPTTVAKVLGQVTADSPPARDVHYLIVLARLQGKRDPPLAGPTAQAILGLDKKLQGLQLRIKQTWDVRLGEVIADLLRKQPGLGDALLKHPALVSPAHVGFAARLPDQERTAAARLFFDAARKDADFTWTAALVELLAELPGAEVRPLFRERWSDLGIRDALLLQLAKDPEEVDRERLLAGLESTQAGVVQTCVRALQVLPRDPAPRQLVPLMKRLRQSLREPKTQALRSEVLALIGRQAGQDFALPKETTDPPAAATYQPVFEWFEKTYPAEAKASARSGEDLAKWAQVLAAVAWDKGDAQRGDKVFRERACAACHSGASRVGPDLAGVGGRFSRDDLFAAILDPDRDVAPAYRVDDFETKDGRRLSGIVVFESADGVIVQTDAATTLRLATDDLAARRPSTRSLMPGGLLKDLAPQDLADLYSYLQSLKADTGPPRSK